MNQVPKSQRILGDSVGYVGPLLGHFRAMLGLCWVIWGSAGGFRAEKNTPNRFFLVGGNFGSVLGLLGLCWGILSPTKNPRKI